MKKGVLLDAAVCFKCGEEAGENFFDNRGKRYRFNGGKLQECKKCCKEYFDDLLVKYKKYARAMRLFCAKYDYNFDFEKVQMLVDKGETSGTRENFLETYLDLISVCGNGFLYSECEKVETTGEETVVNGFEFTDDFFTEQIEDEIERKSGNDSLRMKKWGRKWGELYDREEYKSLDKLYSEYIREGYDCKNPNINQVVIAICENKIQQQRWLKSQNTGGEVRYSDFNMLQDKALKFNQDLIKQTAKSKEKGAESFGELIMELEKTKPAEIEDKSVYRDKNGLLKYYAEHIKRPTYNVILNEIKAPKKGAVSKNE
jgi:hypothetical protein